MGPSEALRRLTRRPGAHFGGVIRSGPALVCTENLIRVDDVMESPKLAE